MSLPQLPALLPHEFFAAVVLAGIFLLICVMVPVQMAAKWRRIRRARVRITCRLCGYRFLRYDPAATCPHCQARNR